MKIIEYDSKIHNDWRSRIRQTSWSAAEFLSSLLDDDIALEEALGPGMRLFLLTEDHSLLAFATLSQIDAIRDTPLRPWIGFVYTSPEYRLQGHARRLLEHIESEARQQGEATVYLATDHTDFYERLGYTYLYDRLDHRGDMSRVYCKRL